MAICIAIMVGLTRGRGTGTDLAPVERLGSFSNDDFSQEWF